MLRPGSRVGAIGARFRPGGVAPFFHFPLDAATGEVLPLDGLLGRDAAILEEGVLAARSDAERVAAVESFLLARRGADADPLVATVVERIRAARGTAPPAALFSGLAPSPRQIERRFLHHVGVSPRQLSRIARFQRALRRLAGGRAVSLTTVAHDCGYYDQSHFIRDFKAFAGLSPRAYRAERHPLADLFSDGD
jgi:AraC-like DNA-binding protein